MPAGLPVNSLVAVSVNLSPPAAQAPTVNSMLVIGDSAIIDVRERLRAYSSLAGVALDFGTSADEYLAAQRYFAQVPAPTQIYVGRWAKTATPGILRGGTLSAAQQAMGNFTAIANGGFKINLDGAGVTNITGINLTGAANLNAVAALIQTAVRAIGTGGFTLATVTWNAVLGQFSIASGTTGAASTASATIAPIAGTDLGPLLNLTAGTLTYLVGGLAAESAVACATVFDTQVTTPWYGLAFAVPAADISISDYLAVAAYIEGSPASSGNAHFFFVTSNEAAAIVSPDTTTLIAQLKALNYNRSGAQWASAALHVAVSMAGRILTVNAAGSNTTINLMYKQEPGVPAETLTPTQAAVLNGNNASYYGAVNNGTSILYNGKTASGQFIDTIWNVDALAGQIQTNVYNSLFTTTTKIPQTDAGMAQISTGVAAACEQFVQNGALGPGVWTVGGFGQLKQNDFVPAGYYIYTPPISTQAPAARAARASVPIQVAAKLAGAVNTANVSILVNP